MAKNDNLKDFLTDVADAIRAKKGTTDLINPQDFSAEIASIETGGGSVESKSVNDVTFYDYDGTVLHSYTKEEFLAMSAMPELPTREGLICQEWNWSFEDAREYVSEYGILDVGATYITDDGLTRLYIEIEKEIEKTVTLYFDFLYYIDWGDGSSVENYGYYQADVSHVYENKGKYTIKVKGTIADAYLNKKCVMGTLEGTSTSILKKAEIGETTKLGENAFSSCWKLESITIPRECTTISQSAFSYAYSIKNITIPQNCSHIQLNSCYKLSSISIPKGCRTGTIMNAYILNRIVLSKQNPEIYSSMFSYGVSLYKIIIPTNITTIQAQCFNHCKLLTIIDFSHYTVIPKLSNKNAFDGIHSRARIIVPDALYDEWKAATNWSSLASKIIKKSDWDASQA